MACCGAEKNQGLMGKRRLQTLCIFALQFLQMQSAEKPNVQSCLGFFKSFLFMNITRGLDICTGM